MEDFGVNALSTSPRPRPVALNLRRPATAPAPEPAPRRPRILVAGEFSAGKSQLINGLIGDRVLPSNVTATALPPVWLTYGPPALHMVTMDGIARPVATLDEVNPETTRFCVRTAPARFLLECDIIDTPGTSDPNMPAACWAQMLDYADAVIWCTNAIQAWRQSEKAVWTDMSDRLRDHAMMVVTHADCLPDERAAMRLMARLHREAGPHFDRQLLASLVNDMDLEYVRQEVSKLVTGLALPTGAPCDIVSGLSTAMPLPDPEAAPKTHVRPTRVRTMQPHPPFGSRPTLPDPLPEPMSPAVADDTEDTFADCLRVFDPAPQAEVQPSASAAAHWSLIERSLDLDDPVSILSGVRDLIDRIDRPSAATDAAPGHAPWTDIPLSTQIHGDDLAESATPDILHRRFP